MKGSGSGDRFMSICVIGVAFEKTAKEKAPTDIQTHLNELLS
jgi:hypothetical protein